MSNYFQSHFNGWIQPTTNDGLSPNLNHLKQTSFADISQTTGQSYGVHQLLPLLFTLNSIRSNPTVSNGFSNNFTVEKQEPFVSYIEPTYLPVQPRQFERTGPFVTWYRWKEIDFIFPTEEQRILAIMNKEFIPENVLPLGLETFEDKLFVSFPKWYNGIPYTLTVLPKSPREESPRFAPYPSSEFYQRGFCQGLTSVFRMKVDTCGRLWVLDSGLEEVITKPKQVCSPAIFIFDLRNDVLLLRYELPEEFVKQDSLYSNIIVDIREENCQDAHAYLTDVWRFGLVVFSLEKRRSWRINHHLFLPDPLAAAFSIHGIDFEWIDGILSMVLSPEDPYTKDRLLYFHPMASFREFYVRTSIIRNETGWAESKQDFRIIGQSRGKDGHALGTGMDRNGIVFYNLVSKDGVGCWNSRLPYKRSNVGIIAQDSKTLFFPNDIKLDKEVRTSVWVLSNRLPVYFYRKLDKNDYNFRIMSAYTDDAIRGTVCENIKYFDAVDDSEDFQECF